MLARRFGLRQKEKIRVIDDCTIGGLNRTTGSREKLRIHAIDEVAAYISWTLTHIQGFSTGDWVGKTYDLTSAYKQFGVSVEDREILRTLTMDHSTGKPVLLGANALPFGATGSVTSFLRVSMSIWFIGVRALGLCWTSYFDDYVLLSRRCLSQNTANTAEMLFDLLGIDFARDGKKSATFDSVVSALGVELDLCGSDGSVRLGHTTKRKEELNAALADVISKGIVDTKAAESLRGRMQWFEGYVFGRTAQRGVRALGELSLKAGKTAKLNKYDIRCLQQLQQRVLMAPPIVISACVLTTWVVFTDGACEGDGDKVGSIGGVLIDPFGRLYKYFSSVVPPAFMLKLCEHSANPIYELELLPVLVSYMCWREHLANCQSVFYLDNDAARAGLTKAFGATQQAEAIVEKVVGLESEICNKPWYGRVPTSSNIADDPSPSRLECTRLNDLGCQRCEVDWCDPLLQVE